MNHTKIAIKLKKYVNNLNMGFPCTKLSNKELKQNLKNLLDGEIYKTYTNSISIEKDETQTFDIMLLDFKEHKFMVSLEYYEIGQHKHLKYNFIDYAYLYNNIDDFNIFIESIIKTFSNDAIKYDRYNYSFIVFKNIQKNIILQKKIFKKLRNKSIIKLYKLLYKNKKGLL